MSWSTVPESSTRPCGPSPAPHLDVVDELLSGRVDGGLGIDDVLHGTGPPGGLRQQLGVEVVGMLTTVHRHVPVTCGRRGGASHVQSEVCVPIGVCVS